MHDHDIAIAHMALADAETVEEAARWRAHWQKHFEAGLTAAHSGDCTKQPWACVRCHVEDALSMVPVYRELFNLK